MKRAATVALAVVTFCGALAIVAVPAQAKGFTINLFSDGKDIKPGDGQCDSNGGKSGDQCTLRAAIMENDARNDSSSSLSLPGGTYTLTIAGSGENKAATGDLDITKNMGLYAQGTVTIKGGTGFNDRILDIPSGSPNVTIHGAKITGGKAPGTENGGGIRDLSAKSLQLADVTLSGNSANSGGGLYVSTPNGDTVNLNIVTVSGNTASAGGGGVDVEGGVDATLNRLTVKSNHAHDGGGLAAFLKPGASGSIQQLGANSTIASNTASGSGGGMDVGRTSAALVVVSGNTASNGGGLALVGGGSGSTISGRVEISGNTATSKGGGIYTSGCGSSCGTVFNANITGNHAKEGGGVYVTDGLTLSSAGVTKNSTSNGTNGGAVVHAGSSGNNLKMTNVTLNGNSGGPVSSGLVVTSKANDPITNVTIAGNTGSGNNGIVVLSGAGSPQVRNSIVASGKATNCTGKLVSLGHNLDSGNSCGFHASGDLVNKAPLLEDPADDNGGFTLTMRLKDSSTSFSPAIDGGTNTGCAATDAREVRRPLDGDQPHDGTATCDIGAYEDSGITGNADIQLNNAVVAPDPVSKGANVTYTMTILNHNGPKSSTNTKVIDILPSSLTFVSCSPSPCSASNGVVTVTVGSLKAGKSVTVKIVAKVSSGATVSQIGNTVNVYSDNPDHYPHNNTEKVMVQIK
jgi:uncharacterized repeat protein (TIGR01451 family)